MTEGLLTSETPEEAAYFEKRGAVEEPAKEPAAEPEEKPAEAKEQPAEAEKEPAKEPAKEAPKLVPYEAMKEERDKRKYWQGEATKKSNEAARIAGRMEILERMANEARQSPPAPAKEPDPLEKLDETYRFTQEQRQREQQTRARQQLVGQYHAAADEFARETPDFGEAYKHLIQHRIQELTEIGHDPATARQIAEDNETAIVALAFQQGANPAERIYKLAKLRGYAGPKPAEAPKATASEKLATVESGTKAAKSLSQASGSAGAVVSMEALLNMDDDEFDKATRGKKWNDLWEKRS